MTLEVPATSPVRAVGWSAATDRGRVRADNQDVLVLDKWAATSVRLHESRARIPLDRPLLAAVVDGMGGQAGGALAAWMVARRLLVDATMLSNVDDAATLLRAVHLEVLGAGRGNATPEMGAAFAAVILRPDGYSVLNVGDCRVYRVADDALGQLSIDDSAPGRLDPTRTVLTQSIGGSEPYEVDPHWFTGSYGEGPQRFVLASDGLAHAGVDAIGTAVLETDADAAAAALMAATLDAGAPDNVSVVVIDVTAAPVAATSA